MSEVNTHYRTCNICEAMCGLEITYRGDEVLTIKGDNEDSFSRGHICPKAVALQDFYRDPDRLRRPVRRTDSGWQEIAWEEALDEIATRFRAIQRDHGRDAVGVYLGNPNAHNLGNILFLPIFYRALGSKSRYSSASADQLPHHVAAKYMLGHGMLIPVPDIDRTDFMLVIGGNPLVSNGSMMTAPDVARRIKAIQQRGGKVIVVDPRRTETAAKATEHLFIRPERDALLLLGMLYTFFHEDLVTLRHLEPFIDGIDELRQAVEPFAPHAVASATGISAERIIALARDMAAAPSAVCYSRMGASTQSYGGLCQWLTNAVNIVTGNFDRQGGAMFTLPAFDFVGLHSRKGRAFGPVPKSRVRGLPCHNSEVPVATMADEILTEGEGRIKALMTIAGNPVLSSPNGKRLESALGTLDFMVSLDPYINETTCHADIILPPVSGLQVSLYDIFFHVFSVRNTAKYSAPLFDKAAGERSDWEILKALAARLAGVAEDDTTPEKLLDQGLRAGPYGKDGMSLATLKNHPHGMDLGPNQPILLNRLQTEDGRLKLAPEVYLADLLRLKAETLDSEADRGEYPLLMIGRRLIRSHNTWTQNSQRLVKGKNPCTVLVHPEDAQRLAIADHSMVQVRSATGAVTMEAEVSEDIMPGVVSIPQGWGHGRKQIRMTVAATQPGISINDLTDEKRVDPLTGNAALNGVPVTIEQAGTMQ